MEITKDILLDILFILVNINTNKTRTSANEILTYYEEQNTSQAIIVSASTEYETILINLIRQLLDLKFVKDKNSEDLKRIYNKLKIEDIFIANSYYLDTLYDIFVNNDHDPQLLQASIAKINNILIWYRCNKYTKKIFGYLRNVDIQNEVEAVPTFNIIDSLSDKLQKTIRHKRDTKELAIENLTLSSKEDIQKAYQRFKERNITGVIKTGWSGLNKMLGERNGIPRGRSVVFAALTHNYKSTMLLNVARWCKEHNNFPAKDGKKPLILFISLENESYENMMMWFRYIYYTDIEPDRSKPLPEDKELIDLIHYYFYSKDLEIAILRYLPNDFGYSELIDLITKYEDDNYYIPVCIVDYLSQMKLVDTVNDKFSNKGNYLLIKDLYSKTCNYLKGKGITLFTGHQLNSQASFLLNTGAYPVKKFNQSHFAGSTDVAREVDIIIYMHIEKNHKGESYLTLSWGKNRYDSSTKNTDKFICYPFTEIGILDDMNKKCIGVKDIYSVSNDTEGSQNVVLDVSY